ARVPGEQTSEAMVPSLAPWTPVPPGVPTSSSPRVASLAPVPQGGAAPASPRERSPRPPADASSRTAQQPQRATLPPVTNTRPTRSPAAPGAPQKAEDAAPLASRPVTARAPQTPRVSRSARPPAVSSGNGLAAARPEDSLRRALPSPGGSPAAPGLGVHALTTPEAKSEAT